MLCPSYADAHCSKYMLMLILNISILNLNNVLDRTVRVKDVYHFIVTLCLALFVCEAFTTNQHEILLLPLSLVHDTSPLLSKFDIP